MKNKSVTSRTPAKAWQSADLSRDFLWNPFVSVGRAHPGAVAFVRFLDFFS
jgi:hypothetical protein